MKNLPSMRETWVRSLGWEDPLAACMATHSTIPAWGGPMDRGSWRVTVHGVAESDTTECLSTPQHSLTTKTLGEEKNVIRKIF